MTHFAPTLYLKKHCPHCFKLRLFLLEAGLDDAFALEIFEPGDDREETIRATLEPHFDRVTFPAAQLEPGHFMKESDAIIDRIAAEQGVDLSALTLFPIFARNILPRYSGFRKELIELKGAI